MNRKAFTFPVDHKVIEQHQLAQSLDVQKDEVIYRNRQKIAPGTEVELIALYSDGVPITEASLFCDGKKVHTQVGLCLEGEWQLAYNEHRIDVDVVPVP
ncbi:hypothetical protein [Endozoicomonas sp. ALC066]|uniref:hypothetical protein n=1 Tax=Endozoicomonas sp. ALC066 TaxID=3403078 RepID=UPI003BB81371